MRETLALLRFESRARRFFAVLVQSSLGTGAGYVALLLVATDRLDSPWAVSVVLMADLVPAMLLGPLFGAAADRWPRRRCAIAAEVLRALAFGGIALVGSFEATVAFALIAGVGTGLFTPAALASLNGLIDDERRVPAATGLYSAIADLGFTAGPAAAALVLLIGDAELILVINAVTFGVSAILLATTDFGGTSRDPAASSGPISLLRETRDGLRATAGMRPLRLVILGSSAALFCGGLFNVGELFFATEDLGASDSGFSILAALFGFGFIAGSLAGAKGGKQATLRRRYLTGLLVMAVGLLASGLAPVFAVGLLTFALAGFGNGLVLVYERLLIQDMVEDSMLGRVFGTKDALACWAFAAAFLTAGGLITLIGTRSLILVAGTIGVGVWAVSSLALRRESVPHGPPVAAESVGGVGSHRGAGASRQGAFGQYRPDLVNWRGHEAWLALLDDVGEGSDHRGIELGPSMFR